MIDYVNVKTTQSGLAEKLLANSKLDFSYKVTDKGNKIWEASYANMKFSIFEPSNIVKLQGSLHYLYNDGNHNQNDFKRTDLSKLVYDLHLNFGIKLDKAQIHGFEFGVNLVVPFKPHYLIEKILAYKTGDLRVETDEKKEILYANFKQYCIKIYDKGLQFGSDENILRIEVKIKAMAKVRSISKKLTLSDISKEEILQKLGKVLKQEFNGLIISEPMKTELMSISQQRKYNLMNNNDFWKAITCKYQRRNKTASFKRLTKRFGNGLKDEISCLISKKWDDLIHSDFTRLVAD